MSQVDNWENVTGFLERCEVSQKAYNEYCAKVPPGQRQGRHFMRNVPERPDNPIWHARTNVRALLAKGIDMLFCVDTLLVDPVKLDSISTALLVSELRPDECGTTKHNGKTWIRLWWD
jgi:hypothetical protein